MSAYRMARLNGQIAQELSQIIGEVKDPRLNRALVSVTRAECAADLKTARVFYSSVGGDEEEVARGLSSAQGFIRSSLAHRLNLRVTPELHFIRDGSIERGGRISRLLHEVGADRPLPDEGGEMKGENGENDE